MNTYNGRSCKGIDMTGWSSGCRNGSGGSSRKNGGSRNSRKKNGRKRGVWSSRRSNRSTKRNKVSLGGVKTVLGAIHGCS